MIKIDTENLRKKKKYSGNWQKYLKTKHDKNKLKEHPGYLFVAKIMCFWLLFSAIHSFDWTILCNKFLVNYVQSPLLGPIKVSLQVSVSHEDSESDSSWAPSVLPFNMFQIYSMLLKPLILSPSFWISSGIDL